MEKFIFTILIPYFEGVESMSGFYLEPYSATIVPKGVTILETPYAIVNMG
jgi:hypothetical protein